MEPRVKAARPRQIAKLSAVFVFCAGLAVLIGWVFNLPDLEHVVPPRAKMTLVTALCLMLGAAAWWLRAHRAERNQRMAEDFSQQSEERLRAIVEFSDDAIISKTLEGVVTTWNRAAEKLFGYTAREAIGHPMLMMFPPERANEEKELLSKIALGQTIEHFDTVRRRKDGSLVDVSVTLSPLKDGKNNIIGASKIARDITARKAEAARLQAQVARLDLLSRITRAIGERQDLDSIYQVLIRSLEEDLPVDFGCVCLHDEAAEAFVARSVGARNEELGRRLAGTEARFIGVSGNGLGRCLDKELVYEPDTQVLGFPLARLLAEAGLRSMIAAPLAVESQVFGLLIVARRAERGFSSGECEFLHQVSSHTALAAHQAQLHAALGAAYEDLRQTHQAIMQQERLRALGEMASGVAHDINNAVSPILLYSALLLERERGLGPAAREHLETIQRAALDVSSTISRLQEFYRKREPQLASDPVQLNDLAEQVVSLTRPRWHDVAQQRGIVIDVKMELAPGLPLILGVESELREALINLVLNAVDALTANGAVILRTSAAAKTVSAQVADNGTGMSEETRRRCLEPFFTTKGERGSGLGLAMVYGIVQRHGGELGIDTELGQGTTITMTFARAARGLAPGTAGVVASAPPRARLLVIDDDPLLLKALRDILETDGHIVATANGGKAGVEAFREAFSRYEPYAAVITDLGMPHLDGRAVAAAIKAASPTTPVILLTGWGRRMALEGEQPAHVDCVLSKPPKPADLREALTRHLRPE